MIPEKEHISQHLKDALQSLTAPVKAKQTGMVNSLLHNLTSKECIREMAIKDLGKINIFTEKERKAKERYTRKHKTANKVKKTDTYCQKTLEDMDEEDFIWNVCKRRSGIVTKKVDQI